MAIAGEIKSHSNAAMARGIHVSTHLYLHFVVKKLSLVIHPPFVIMEQMLQE